MADINNKPTKKTPDPKPKKLTIKEKAFIREYVKSGNGTQSVIAAGYDCKNDNSASTRANQILRKSEVQAEISRLMEKKERSSIMTGQEVLELFSAIARGEVKDQFGLDASLNDRLKAMNEIAKRTVDIENRMKGIPDSNVSIKLDWGD